MNVPRVSVSSTGAVQGTHKKSLLVFKDFKEQKAGLKIDDHSYYTESPKCLVKVGDLAEVITLL